MGVIISQYKFEEEKVKRCEASEASEGFFNKETTT